MHAECNIQIQWILKPVSLYRLILYFEPSYAQALGDFRTVRDPLLLIPGLGPPKRSSSRRAMAVMVLERSVPWLTLATRSGQISLLGQVRPVVVAFLSFSPAVFRVLGPRARGKAYGTVCVVVDDPPSLMSGL
jgi:hypothetical protein